jgi:hypothetical protein
MLADILLVLQCFSICLVILAEYKKWDITIPYVLCMFMTLISVYFNTEDYLDYEAIKKEEESVNLHNEL